MRFVMLGGFLGAGKTTSVARLAEAYQARGERVVIVTNDQAADLVDTNSLRAQGYAVGEVAGSCFCCNFHELTATVERLAADRRPDVVLAEPVGSCTDLVATVVQPLLQLHPDRFNVAPYGVLLKPSHGRRILRGEPQAGFSPKAAYIFRKQLEEADFILLNRVDELRPDEVEELAGLLASEFPGVPVLRVSARTGAGFETLLQMLDQRGSFGGRVLDIDYDLYAAGEAELGWLNGTLQVRSPRPIPLDAALVDLVARLAGELAAADAEAAHVKVIALAPTASAVANLVSRQTGPELSRASDALVDEAQLVVNARVAIDPVLLESIWNSAATAWAAAQHCEIELGRVQSLRPGRPVPTHRLEPAAEGVQA